MADVKYLEYRGWTDNGNPSSKYWQISRTSGGGWRADWGKIGTSSNNPTFYAYAEGLKKAQQKLNKGYRLVREYDYSKNERICQPENR